MLEATNELGNVALQAGGTLTDPSAAAALAVGLAALGAGYAERGIGSAAVARWPKTTTSSSTGLF